VAMRSMSSKDGKLAKKTETKTTINASECPGGGAAFETSLLMPAVGFVLLEIDESEVDTVSGAVMLQSSWTDTSCWTDANSFPVSWKQTSHVLFVLRE
jgi:hypothetical protein